jgi:Flp pilus assembly pilin Flp
MAALLRARLWLTLGRFDRTDDRGASLVEYALLLALIAIVCFVAVEFLGGEASSMYEGTGNSLAN